MPEPIPIASRRLTAAAAPIIAAGDRFGLLTVVERASNMGRRRRWVCRCDCGGETVAKTWDLTSENRRSCGCLQRDRQRARTDSYEREVLALANLGQASVDRRFWSKVKKTDGCWLWTGRCSDRGYGYFWLSFRWIRAHRYAYALRHGPISPGLHVHHTCYTRNCVRIDHLRLVTMAENIFDASSSVITAINSRKTHCPRGHPLVEAKKTDTAHKRRCAVRCDTWGRTHSRKEASK